MGIGAYRIGHGAVAGGRAVVDHDDVQGRAQRLFEHARHEALRFGGLAVVDADEKDGILSRRRCLFRPGGEFGGAFYQERSLSRDERQNRAGTRGILTVAYRDVATPIA